ncbi:MAG: hypothetical protein BGO95_10690 [Micrococcales bacterium 73-13]|nr:MAG: hypothetical protein BGO95_10690 [Micrococcales bacterium 73-13]
MSRCAAGQLAFDLDTLIHDADVQAASPWGGPAPLHFTTAYYTSGDLAAAFERYRFEHGNFACVPRSHMWHPAITMEDANTATPGHGLAVLGADLRCDHHGQTCQCVGGYLYRAICEPCRWQATDSEQHVIELWHDHSWPGWRDLPVVPARIVRWDEAGRPSPKLTAWVEEHQPLAWQVPGAPILTERPHVGTRHVPRRSPWGGFDLSHTALTDPGHE